MFDLMPARKHTAARERKSRPPPAAEKASDESLGAHKCGLTSREAEILRWISEGKRDREIATILGISTRTAQNHVHNILEKLGLETRTAAAKFLFESLKAERVSSSPEAVSDAAK